MGTDMFTGVRVDICTDIHAHFDMQPTTCKPIVQTMAHNAAINIMIMPSGFRGDMYGLPPLTYSPRPIAMYCP